ncbi:uncharacterized protein K452DRAFT_245058 [Aplosporella prunicola CBS 121167]|uniref:NAD(P)-binding protein n=1 Tax=Aplosporella prunicola CBS 121167 TaxID=1176127 RepID=A0A6A6BMB5_9PEZI|nr:uncharacterized protein K452DRAFT_245058 [Aplosporella prunicola CBS 121167]KAF2145269.1 hypothetical protein K452DRAFT_245058 [Aplosporella prunicola CBS 121167]
MSFLTGNKFDPNKDIPDLNGKVYVVTGGSAGIGFGIVAHLLQHNAAKIYLLSNKEQHAEEAQEELKKYGDVSRVEWKKCNLEDLSQVDQVAKELSKLEQLDGLICNAGLGVGVYNETRDGIDSHMQVNHISQFHLVMCALPVLQKTANSRLVLQSSELHRSISDVQFASLAELNRDIGPTKLYNRTKLAQVLFVRSLARHAAKDELGFTGNGTAHGPWINATHPGGVKTDQQDQAVEAYGTLGKVGVAAIRPFLKDPIDEGCRAALFAATSEDVVKEKIQGQYIVPDRKVTEPSKEAQDEALQECLWKLTEHLLMEKVPGGLPYGPVHVDNLMFEGGLHGNRHTDN